jgi:hypothetical protein
MYITPVCVGILFSYFSYYVSQPTVAAKENEYSTGMKENETK